MLTTDEFNGEDILVDEVADTAGQAEKRILQDKLRQAIALLPDEEQQLLQMIYSRQLSERKIAAKLGLSQNAINKQKSRILAKLKKVLII